MVLDIQVLDYAGAGDTMWRLLGPGACSGAGQRPGNRVGTGSLQAIARQGRDYRVLSLVRQLKPVAEAITRTAQPRYPHPFKFFLVHEAQPNAFATPGGNVYVVDSLLYFVKNTGQLAGTLCHEVSHTIHRDGVALMEKEQKIEEREVAAAILLGPTRAHIIAIALIGKLHSLGYSRDAESKADVTGSDICAEAGYNPWGLSWLFQDFQDADARQIPQLLSDHPANGTRIGTLEEHFRDNPSTFSKFSRDPKSATPFSVPKDAPEVFLRADIKAGN